MMENLRKALMMGLGYHLLASHVNFAPADDEGEELGLIELDESLDDVEKPEELAAGTYEAEVQDVQVQTSSKGNKYFAVKFVIPPEQIAADLREGFPDGAVLYWNRQVVPKAGDRRAMWNLKRFIEALGLPTNTNQIDPNEWMGQRARLRVRMGKWEGQERAEIQSVEAAESEARPAGRTARTQRVVEEAAPPAKKRAGRR